MIRAREIVHRQFQDPPRDGLAFNPKKIKKALRPEDWDVDGTQLLTVHGVQISQIHIIFLPGGAYLMEATSFHRQFAEKLARSYGCSVSLVNYPKAPEHTYKTTHTALQSIYLQFQEKFPDQEFCLLGDSAGGGLALAFLQTLRDGKHGTIPTRTVLISPWLDLSLSNPELPDYVERDLILPLTGLKYAAGLYASGTDLQNPLLSPLYGDLSGLGDIQLIFGTEEILYPDCCSLIKKIQASPGTNIKWEIGEGKIHAWPIFPLPESKAVLGRIAEFLLNSPNSF